MPFNLSMPRFTLLSQLLLLRARIDFGSDAHQRKLTLTFNFLSSILSLLAGLTTLWAITAGALHAGFLATRITTVFDPQAAAAWTGAAAWLAPVLGLPLYVLQAFATALLVFLAAASVGAIVGFLFGVPRPISESGADTAPSAPAPAATAGPQPTDQQRRRSADWKASTNLTQVSDWLTKIIVGVGLVESKAIFESFGSLAQHVSGSLFNGMHGVAIVIPCVILAGIIMGFLYSYLFTQLFLAAMMVYSAEEIGESRFQGREAAVAELQRLPAASSTIAAAMGKSPPPAPPTAAQTDAAQSVTAVPLDSLQNAADIQTWSRGQAISRDYTAAAAGYRRLVKLLDTPEVLAEAARVIAQSGAQKEASELLRRAVVHRDEVSADVRLRITSDAANLSLYDPPPQGFTYALSLLDDKVVNEDTRIGQLWVLRACANGQKLRALAPELTGEAKDRLADTILADVTRAVQVNPDMKKWLNYLWDPTAGNKVGQPDGIRDDDLELFFDDPRFKAVLGEP